MLFRAAHPVGIERREQQPLRVTLVQFGFDVGAHVDAVDRQVADESRDLHVEQPRVADLHVREVHTVEPGAAEVGFEEPRVLVVVHAACVLPHLHEGNR